MKQHVKFLVLVAALAGSSALAQMGPFGGISSMAMNPTMAKIFSTSTSASAKAQFTINDTAHGDNIQMEMAMMMLDGKTRMELDMSQVKSSKIPPNATMQMKRFGMDKMVMISLPQKKENLVIYPTMHAYAEMSTEQAQAATPQPEDHTKIEKTSLGRETIDGHDCEKNKVVMTNDKGDHHEATVWNASDLKDFPVQMQIDDKSGTSITIKFRDVKLEKPDAGLFDPPSDFTKYDSPQVLIQSEIMKKATHGGFGH
jgi:hypothetical protein